MNRQRLEQLYELNSERGELVSRRTGRPIGSINGSGYLTFRVDGVTLYVHRAIHFLATGEQPALVDHINRNKLDNRPANLRSATARQNQMNRTRQGRGIYRRGEKWVAQAHGRYLGIFNTESEALAARAIGVEQPA